MTRRTKLLITLTLIVVAIGIAVLVLLRRGGLSALAPISANVPGAATATPTSLSAPANDNLIPEPTPFARAEAVARSFVERWGSFSTESNFGNVEDLYASMTPTMRSWATTYVVDQRKAQAGNTSFYGVTTKVVRAEVLEQSDSKIRFKITTQRTETKGTHLPTGQAGAPVSAYQDMEVALLKQGDAWFVDGAWWK